MLGDPEDLPKAEAVECGLLNMTVGARCATLVSGLRMLRDGAEIWARKIGSFKFICCVPQTAPHGWLETLRISRISLQKKTIPIPGVKPGVKCPWRTRSNLAPWLWSFEVSKGACRGHGNCRFYQDLRV
jgi:hypothetical protein